jgi:DNA invertase Pin-like site-specific DNA recombinase
MRGLRFRHSAPAVGKHQQVNVRHGWNIAAEFSNRGISGAKGQEHRSGLDGLLRAVTKREADIVLAWSVDRLSRSLQDLLGLLAEFHALYLHQQGIDTSTPAGKALFQMMGVFAEFERAIIRERVRSGLARAKAQGKILGRRRNDDPKRLASVRSLRKKGIGIGKIARTLGIGSSYVQRVVVETEGKRSGGWLPSR